jgi:glycerophosphoryl diester phosphodiesterase
VSDLTYNELLEYDAGLYLNSIFAGEKVPLLSDFFKMCAKTGMRPMLSVHPALSEAEWGDLKALAIKYGVLERLHVKSFYTQILETAYSVFGDSIDGYTYDVGSFSNYEEVIQTFQNIGIDSTKNRCVIEWNMSNITSTIASATISAGYGVSVWNLGRPTGEKYHELIDMGVTEFTDDYNCSYGLEW